MKWEINRENLFKEKSQENPTF